MTDNSNVSKITDVEEEFQAEPLESVSFSNATENQQTEQEEMNEATYSVTDTNVNHPMPTYSPFQTIIQGNEFQPQQIIGEPFRPITYVYQTIPPTNQLTNTWYPHPTMNPIPLNPNACSFNPINQQLTTQSEAKFIYKCPQPEMYIARCPNCHFSALKVQIFKCDICSFNPPVTQQCSYSCSAQSAISIPLSFIHIDENKRRSDSCHGHSSERSELNQSRNSNFNQLCQDPSHRLPSMSSTPMSCAVHNSPTTPRNNSTCVETPLRMENVPQTPIHGNHNHGCSYNHGHSNVVNNPMYMQVPNEARCMFN